MGGKESKILKDPSYFGQVSEFRGNPWEDIREFILEIKAVKILYKLNDSEMYQLLNQKLQTNDKNKLFASKSYKDVDSVLDDLENHYLNTGLMQIPHQQPLYNRPTAPVLEEVHAGHFNVYPDIQNFRSVVETESRYVETMQKVCENCGMNHVFEACQFPPKYENLAPMLPHRSTTPVVEDVDFDDSYSDLRFDDLVNPPPEKLQNSIRTQRKCKSCEKKGCFEPSHKNTVKPAKTSSKSKETTKNFEKDSKCANTNQNEEKSEAVEMTGAKPKIRCWYCKQFGHQEENCRKKLSKLNVETKIIESVTITNPVVVENIFCRYCKSKDHLITDCNKRPPCVHCNRIGHKSNQCPQKVVQIAVKHTSFCSTSKNPVTSDSLKPVSVEDKPTQINFQCKYCKATDHLISDCNKRPRCPNLNNPKVPGTIETNNEILSSYCDYCKAVGHKKIDCVRLKNKPRCYRCQSEFHKVHQCPLPPRNSRRNDDDGCQIM